MSVKVLRQLIRATLTEAIELSTQQKTVKRALDDVAQASGGKAAVLFSRIMTKRISQEEIDQMADEVRTMAQANPKVVQQFNVALEDTLAGVEAPNRLGDMISQTLAKARPISGVRAKVQAPPDKPVITMRSLIKSA